MVHCLIELSIDVRAGDNRTTDFCIVHGRFLIPAVPRKGEWLGLSMNDQTAEVLGVVWNIRSLPANGGPCELEVILKCRGKPQWGKTLEDMAAYVRDVLGEPFKLVRSSFPDDTN